MVFERWHELKYNGGLPHIFGGIDIQISQREKGNPKTIYWLGQIGCLSLSIDNHN